MRTEKVFRELCQEPEPVGGIIMQIRVLYKGESVRISMKTSSEFAQEIKPFI